MHVCVHFLIIATTHSVTHFLKSYLFLSMVPAVSMCPPVFVSNKRQEARYLIIIITAGMNFVS